MNGGEWSTGLVMQQSEAGGLLRPARRTMQPGKCSQASAATWPDNNTRQFGDGDWKGAKQNSSQCHAAISSMQPSHL